MVFKYKESIQWKFLASIWLFVVIMNVGQLIFLMNESWGSLTIILTTLYIIIIFLGLSLSIYFFKIPSIDYVMLTEQKISIHKGLILPRKEILFCDIEEARVINNKLVLILKNEKEVSIDLTNLAFKDSDRIKQQLAQYFPVS